MDSATFEDYSCTFAGAELLDHRVKPEEYKALLDKPEPAAAK